MSSLPLCPSSLCVLPPFLSFLPSCPSMRQSLSFSTYLAISSLFGGAVHSASPPLPSCLILLMKSNIFCCRCCHCHCLLLSSSSSNVFPLLRLTNTTYHISLHGLLVRNRTPLCPAHVVKLVQRALPPPLSSFWKMPDGLSYFRIIHFPPLT